MLHLYDISRTVVTRSKHCSVDVRTLDFTRCVVALPACICFACVSSLDAGCDPSGASLLQPTEEEPGSEKLSHLSSMVQLVGDRVHTQSLSCTVSLALFLHLLH